jgi:tetratricopeptide (TPR) repeat protein
MYFLKAHSIFERIHWWESHPDMAMSYKLVAEALYGRGDYHRALEKMRDALNQYVNIYGKLHLKTAQVYESVASILLDAHSNFHDQALANHHRALAICKELLGKNHSDTAWSHHLIGMTLTHKGELDAAIGHQQKALTILENVRGSNVLMVAQFYEAIVLSLNNIYDFVGALENYQKALKLYAIVYGKRHLDAAWLYKFMASSLDTKGNIGGAFKNHRMLLRILLALLGKNHYLTSTSYYGIAHLLERMGDNKAAALQNLQNTLLAQESLLLLQHHGCHSSWIWQL